MTTDLLRRFAQLSREKGELKDRLSEVEKALEAMQLPLQEYFLSAGMQNTRVDGMTLYVRKQTWARLAEGIEMPQACDALKAAGLGEFVREAFNMQTLSSYVRELQRDERELPESLADFISVTDDVSIQARRTA